jgi:hypothetical protein
MSMNRQQRRMDSRSKRQEQRRQYAAPRSDTMAVPRATGVRPPGVMQLPIFGEVETGTVIKVAGIGAAVILVVALLAFSIWRTVVGAPSPELDESPRLAGQFFAHQGRLHLQPGQVFAEYNSNPPTSGPHDPRVPQFRIYNDPVSASGPITKEQLVHAMEHGGVIIWHNCTDCDSTVETMKEITRKGLLADRNLIMVPYPEMEPNTIAFTAWTRLEKFPVSEFTAERMEKFIKDHDRRFNPENVP